MTTNDKNKPTFGECLHNFYGGGSSYTAVAASVAIDNHMLDGMNPQDWNDWLHLACAIEAEMGHNDEPRFTLYDYLDAAVNGNCDWTVLAKMSRSDNVDAFWETMVKMAEYKRRTYEGDEPVVTPMIEGEFNTALIVTDNKRTHPIVALFSVPESLIEQDCAGLAVKRYFADVAATKTGRPSNTVTWSDIMKLTQTDLAGTDVGMLTEPFMLVISGRSDEIIAPNHFYRQDVMLAKEEAKRVHEYLAGVAQQDIFCPIHRIAIFPDGREMHITCFATAIGSKAAATLYDANGVALSETKNREQMTGSWKLTYGGQTYETVVLEAKH